MGLLLNRLQQVRRAGLLLILAAAVTGFILLINLLAGPVSSGPSDLLAENPAREEYFELPNAAKAFAFGLVALGIVLAIAVFALSRRLASEGSAPKARRSSLVIGTVVALVVLGAVIFLAMWIGSGAGRGEPDPEAAGEETRSTKSSLGDWNLLAWLSLRPFSCRWSYSAFPTPDCF